MLGAGDRRVEPDAGPRHHGVAPAVGAKVARADKNRWRGQGQATIRSGRRQRGSRQSTRARGLLATPGTRRLRELSESILESNASEAALRRRDAEAFYGVIERVHDRSLEIASSGVAASTLGTLQRKGGKSGRGVGDPTLAAPISAIVNPAEPLPSDQIRVRGTEKCGVFGPGSACGCRLSGGSNVRQCSSRRPPRSYQRDDALRKIVTRSAADADDHVRHSLVELNSEVFDPLHGGVGGARRPQQPMGYSPRL